SRLTLKQLSLSVELRKMPSTLAVGISPHGNWFLESSDSGVPNVSEPIAKRIELAFVGGNGSALLHLGTIELATDLSPSLAYWRELSRLFLSRLCALPALEETRERLHVPAPDADFV